jgi:predicted RNA-binding Zn-ribbon protein involved in translation (DUF1610 family)
MNEKDTKLAVNSSNHAVELVNCSSCYAIVKPKRLGRAHYHCPKCDADISMTVFYYREVEIDE